MEKLVFTKNSDGNLVAEPMYKPQGTMFGALAYIKGEATEEKLAKAKEIVVDEVCEIIRKIARERDDFFIIKSFEEKTSVGHKFFLPTVEEYINFDDKEIQIVD
jgi:hypothetical protein